MKVYQPVWLNPALSRAIEQSISAENEASLSLSVTENEIQSIAIEQSISLENEASTNLSMAESEAKSVAVEQHQLEQEQLQPVYRGIAPPTCGGRTPRNLEQEYSYSLAVCGI